MKATKWLLCAVLILLTVFALTAVSISLGVIDKPGIGKLFSLGRALVGGLFQIRQMRRHAPVMTSQIIVDGAVLAIGDHGIRATSRIALMGIGEWEQEMGLVDITGGDGGGGNHFGGAIYRPMGFVGELRSSLAHNGGIRIGGGAKAFVDVAIRPGARAWVIGLIQATLELFIAFIELALKRVRVDHRVIRGIGLDEARIDKEFAPIDEPGLHTLPDDALEEDFKDDRAPAAAGLGKHTVIGDIGIEVVA